MNLLNLILFINLCTIPHIEIAGSFVGVQELTGKNDGKEIEMFLKYVGRKKGNAWCAAFVSFCIGKANVKYPKIKSGLARSFKTKHSINSNQVLQGRVFIPPGSVIIWQNGNTIFGHVGFVFEWNKSKGTTIEGNTSPPNKYTKNNYEGVFVKERKIEPANYFRIKWFTLIGDW